MPGLGVFYALTAKQEMKLRSTPEPSAMMALIDTLEERWVESSTQETDTAWKGIYTCLSSTGAPWNTVSVNAGVCILSEQLLSPKEEYIISFTAKEVVHTIASILATIQEAYFRNVYFQLPVSSEIHTTEEEFHYYWQWFEAIRTFYHRTSKKKRAIVFTAEL